MQLSSPLIIFFLQLHCTSSFPDQLHLEGTGTVTAVNDYHNKGYECGNVFFSDLEANRIYQLGLSQGEKENYYPQKYIGPLYSDSETTEYLLWPLRKRVPRYFFAKDPRTSFHAVSSRAGVIDVIARITNNENTKCTRRDDSNSGSSTPASEDTNGYQCGHKFFDDGIIQKSLGLARQKIGQQNPYPTPYFGRLYPEEFGYMMWPILSRGSIYKSGKGQVTVYFIVISSDGQLIEPVVKSFYNNFIRCLRSRRDLEAPQSDTYSSSLATLESNTHSESFESLQTGFQCGRVYFDDNLLSKAADTAMRFAFQYYENKYPMKYNGYPFFEPCWLWPISADGNSRSKGGIGPHRVVLTLDFQVMSVAIVVDDKVEACERRVITKQKEHDLSAYFCHSVTLTHEELANAADMGCKMLRIAKNTYPKRYEGPRFEKDGPYLTYPVFPEVNFKRNPGLHRVVFNSNCEIVGALTTLIDPTRKMKRFVKCQRLEDDPLPKKMIFNPSKLIAEHVIKNSRLGY